MGFLIKDGVRYNPHPYKNEGELQRLVQANIDKLFGPDAFFFPGTKIGAPKGQAGVKGIPDGFVLSIPSRRWYIVEVELVRHSFFDHIAPQVMRFYAAWEDSSKRKALKDRFSDALEESPSGMEALSRHGVREVYRFVSDILEQKPTLAVVIDEETRDLDQLKGVVHFDIRYSVFRTFAREGVSDLVPIFLLDSFEGGGKPTQQEAPGPAAGEGGEYVVFLGKRERISTIKEILPRLANELVERGELTEGMLPWGPGRKRYLVSKTPVHPNGKDFFAPVQLDNGWWVETHSSREGTLRYANHLIKKCGLKSHVTVERG